MALAAEPKIWQNYNSVTSNNIYVSTTASFLSFLNYSSKDKTTNDFLRLDDIIVFVGLESLGTLAVTGNLCLIVVLLRNKYLQRARYLIVTY